MKNTASDETTYQNDGKMCVTYETDGILNDSWQQDDIDKNKIKHVTIVVPIYSQLAIPGLRV